MSIFCNECHTESAAPEAAITTNGQPGVCPACYSENWQRAGALDSALDKMLAEIRRAAKAREFMLGGLS